MDNPGDILDIPVKKSQCVGIGQHKTGYVRAHGRFQGL